MKDRNDLRRGDFWTSLVLMAIAAAMLIGATTFPMKDSYGGVQNVWYVSPALFPLIVGVSLSVLSLVLLINAVASGGARSALERIRQTDGRLADRDVRLLVVIVLLCGYVYALVPRVDFFVGAALFLQTFILAFHPDRPQILKLNVGGFIAYSVGVGGLALAGLSFGRDSVVSMGVDIAGLLGLIALAVASWMLVRDDDPGVRVRVRRSLILGTAVPLILCPAFKYLLLVPLPAEGLVIQAMDAVRYALRGVLG